ncbi:hypothetical protein HPB51_002983 [Rhipicephalus microplus]|uniref:Transmembrane protein n=1 Tax=Rhipicephalus microplus TaxID=6941 RepID=A0A9J6EFD1_RHIMP|nr:hypothetical protein HPB51_002983 [Rhipicephalus microplus]
MRSPTTSPLESSESTRSMGYHPSDEDSTSTVIACPSELLAHMPAVLRAPDFTATSNNAPPNTQHRSRGQESLLIQEPGASLAHEPEDSKTSTLRYFLIGILLSGLVFTAVLATVNARGGALAAYDLLPEEEQRPGLHKSRFADDAPKDVLDQELLVVAPSISQQLQPLVMEPTNRNKTINELENNAQLRSAALKKQAQDLDQLEPAAAEKYVNK